MLFVIGASITAGALIPRAVLDTLLSSADGQTLRNLRNLLLRVPVWGFDGTLVDLLYRSEAAWFGDVVTLPVVAAKICVDQFGYNPFFAAPFGVLTYEWKNNGVSLRPVATTVHVAHYRDKIIPTLLATWAVWIPLMAIIYSLPLALQFPLFGLALSFWVLLLTYMTNRFAGKIEADAPLALAVAEVEGVDAPERAFRGSASLPVKRPVDMQQRFMNAGAILRFGDITASGADGVFHFTDGVSRT